METYIPLLEKLGLSKTEARVYFSALGLGIVGAFDIAKKTGIKRTTVYNALHLLMKRGLAAKSGTASRTVYHMTLPDQISRMIDQKIGDLEREKKAVSLLTAHAQKTLPKRQAAKTIHYEGVEGVKAAIEEALYCKSRTWDIIAPSKNFFSDFDSAYSRYFIETRKRRGITARSLWERDPKRKGPSPEDIAFRQPRYLPDHLKGTFVAVMILFDNKTLILSSLTEEPSAVILESNEFQSTIKALFDGLWSVSAKP